MNYIRRLYYELSTGKVICSFCSMSTLALSTVDQDYERRSQLAPYAERREEVGMFEWDECDQAIEDAFNNSYDVAVDITTTPPTLVFDYNFPVIPDEMDELLEQLEEVLA